VKYATIDTTTTTTTTTDSTNGSTRKMQAKNHPQDVSFLLLNQEVMLIFVLKQDVRESVRVRSELFVTEMEMLDFITTARR